MPAAAPSPRSYRQVVGSGGAPAGPSNSSLQASVHVPGRRRRHRGRARRGGRDGRRRRCGRGRRRAARGRSSGSGQPGHRPRRSRAEDGDDECGEPARHRARVRPAERDGRRLTHDGPAARARRPRWRAAAGTAWPGSFRRRHRPRASGTGSHGHRPRERPLPPSATPRGPGAAVEHEPGERVRRADPHLLRLLARVVHGAVRRMPLTPPIWPSPKPSTLRSKMVLRAAFTHTRGRCDRLVETGRVRPPLPRQLVGHDRVAGGTATGVVTVVVAGPQPLPEGRQGALEESPRARAMAAASPSRRPMAIPARTAASHSEPP